MIKVGEGLGKGGCRARSVLHRRDEEKTKLERRPGHPLEVCMHGGGGEGRGQDDKQQRLITRRYAQI